MRLTGPLRIFYVGADSIACVRTPAIPMWARIFARFPRRLCVFDSLMLLGFWEMHPGDWYINGRWNWRWWRGGERAFAELNDNASLFGCEAIPIEEWRNRNWFQRFGWWLERTFS
jgi:hypothetical protein